MTTLDPYRQPDEAPTGSEIANQAAFKKLVESQLTDVRASAAKWQAGLATFITLVSAGLIVKGPDKAADLTDEWRILLALLAGGGLIFAVSGLWAALRASAGTPKVTSFDEVTREYGTVDGLNAAIAIDAVDDLRIAKNRMVIALILIGSAVFASWWAEGDSKAVKLSVTTNDKQVVCGELKSGDQQKLVLEVDGESQTTTIDFGNVKNLRPVASCG
jgi:hypothetical protein